MAERDENGRLKKGHGGLKPQGAKSQKTLQWEALGESITGQQAEQFNDFLNKLWGSRNDEDKMIASELYLKTLEYFKPKQARNTIVGDADAPVQIIISDKL
jgi:hypothetical protein